MALLLFEERIECKQKYLETPNYLLLLFSGSLHISDIYVFPGRWSLPEVWADYYDTTYTNAASLSEVAFSER